MATIHVLNVMTKTVVGKKQHGIVTGCEAAKEAVIEVTELDFSIKEVDDTVFKNLTRLAVVVTFSLATGMIL